MAQHGTQPQPDRRRSDGRTTSLQVDVASLAYILGALLTALAVLALFRAASSSITKVAVGVLLAAALDPLVVRARRTFHWTRTGAVALVATVLVGTFAAIAVLLAPPAIRQAQDLTSELPDTIRRTYSWPIIGERLEKADAAAEVDRFMELAVKAKSQPMMTVSFVPPLVDTADPDVGLIQERVQQAIERSESRAEGSPRPGTRRKNREAPAGTATTGGSIGSLSQGYAANDAADLGAAC